jgi:hypothetical protein
MSFEKPTKYEWRVVASFAAIRGVYVEPAGMKDLEFLEDVLRYLVKRKEITQVIFFDDPDHVVKRMPMTDEQMRHWKATYNWNPNTKFDRFVFVEITDDSTSPPDMKEINTTLCLGYGNA